MDRFDGDDEWDEGGAFWARVIRAEDAFFVAWAGAAFALLLTAMWLFSPWKSARPMPWGAPVSFATVTVPTIGLLAAVTALKCRTRAPFWAYVCLGGLMAVSWMVSLGVAGVVLGFLILSASR